MPLHFWLDKGMVTRRVKKFPMVLRPVWLPRQVRNASGNGGGLLLGYMPVVSFALFLKKIHVSNSHMIQFLDRRPFWSFWSFNCRNFGICAVQAGGLSKDPWADFSNPEAPLSLRWSTLLCRWSVSHSVPWHSYWITGWWGSILLLRLPCSYGKLSMPKMSCSQGQASPSFKKLSYTNLRINASCNTGSFNGPNKSAKGKDFTRPWSSWHWGMSGYLTALLSLLI